MKFRTPHLRLATICIALLILAACRAKPGIPVVGKWDVIVQSPNSNVSQMAIKADVKKDGTFSLTGPMEFQGLTGKPKITGRYKFNESYEVHVEMDDRALDYQPTNYTIQVISSDELVLNTAEYAITMRRRD